MNDVNFRNKENDISFWNNLFQKKKILQKCHSTCTNVILFDSDIYIYIQQKMYTIHVL